MMKHNTKYATERMEALRTTAKASQYISHIHDLKPSRAVLYVRESSQTQKDNLLHQRTYLKTEVEKRSFPIIAVFEEIAPGWQDCRIGFKKAILKAQAAGAVVIAESV